MSYMPFDDSAKGAAVDQTRYNAQAVHSFYALNGKRVLDIVVALVLIVAVLPIVLAIGFIMIVTGGMPIFAHPRIGKNRSTFKCLKFRTMRKDSSRALRFMLRTDARAAREWSEAQKLTFDPRITRLGNFLRKTSIDELPQLLNVLRGEMSMVGPRPVTEKELRHYGADLPAYLSVRPGLTGYWQVHGRGTSTYAKRVAMDRAYVENINIKNDLMLMVQTVSVVLNGEGS